MPPAAIPFPKKAKESAMKAIATGAAAAVLAATLAACGSTEVVRAPVNVSVGQQLIDLKKARDSGALSPREYEQQKAQLIRSVE
jgi:hypothetical protein